MTNRTIKEGTKKRLNKSKGKWPIKLTHVLWSYRTTPRKATGQTPYSLVYRTEALLTIEVNCPTIQTLNFDLEKNEEGRLENLASIEELREWFKLKRKAFNERINKLHNSKVKRKGIRVGDQTEKTKLRSRKPKGGVFGPN